MGDVYAYIHILEARIRELEAREERVRQRLNAQHKDIYDCVLGCPCTHCDREISDVYTEIDYHGDYCFTCGKYICDACMSMVQHGRCDICRRWFCDKCIARGELRRVAMLYKNRELDPASVKNVCSNHLAYKYPLYVDV